jgi:hypothetical protein
MTPDPYANDRAIISMDGNMACCLLGEDLMVGEAEFVDPNDAPYMWVDQIDKEKWAMTQAHKRLCERLGRQLGYRINAPHWGG